MNIIEIGVFLLPHDLFQLLFLIIIVISSGATIFAVKKSAIPKNWEKNWNNHTPNNTSDNLDAEHGSLTDLSQAIASKPEKLAEIMPGLLLIFGLLGTFLGLGIALDKASEILQHAQISGMDQAMKNLMGMMDGLGTKFKTSTWGIIGFLSLKAWATINNFDERRLRWCIQKIKKQLDEQRNILNQERDKQSILHDDRTQKTVEAIEKLYKTVEREISLNRVVLEHNNEILNKQLKESEQTTRGMEAISQSIITFTQANTNNLDSMSATSNKMANAADNMGVAASGLNESITRFQLEISSVLNSLEKNLEQTISSMSKDLSGATEGISVAVNSMSDQVKETMAGIGIETQKATKLQQSAFATFETTSQTLNENVAGMTSLIEQLKCDITTGLDAVSDKRQQTVKAMQDIEKASKSMVEMTTEMTHLGKIIIKPREYEQKILLQLEALGNQIVSSLSSRTITEMNQLSNTLIKPREYEQKIVEQLELLKNQITTSLAEIISNTAITQQATLVE